MSNPTLSVRKYGLECQRRYIWLAVSTPPSPPLHLPLRPALLQAAREILRAAALMRPRLLGAVLILRAGVTGWAPFFFAQRARWAAAILGAAAETVRRFRATLGERT